MGTTNYFDTFITVAPDAVAEHGSIPPEKPESPSVAWRTWNMIESAPYAHTSDDVIFTVWADRRGIPDVERAAEREEFFSKGQPCLRSSDLGKRYGWGVHSDAEGRVALYGVETATYAALAAGEALDDDSSDVAVTAAMRSKR